MHVLGIDGGTESLRAQIFHVDGTSVGHASAPYDTAFSAGGRAEQASEDWWRAMGGAVRSVLSATGVPPEEIVALSVATTSCTVVALDADGAPLRPAILWMDMRASQEAEDLLATGDPALALNGAGQGPVSAEWMIPKALWLARHEPEVFDRAATIGEFQDFMTLRLTGRRAASLSNIALRWHYGSSSYGWPLTLLSAAGIPELAAKWPQDILAPGDPIGPLTAASAAYLGLSPRTVVIQGGVDALIGLVGLGVARPGQLALITGSSHLQFGVTDHEAHAAGLWGTYRDAVYPGRYLIEGGQTSTGSIIAWLRRLTGDSDLSLLNEKAARLGPGADGLLVLDHFQGNRTPYTDPLSRGAFVGLSLHHGPEHLMRAIMEGVGFGTRLIIERMAEAGFAAEEITLGGGAARSDLWLQIHADTARLPIVVRETSAAPSLGAAILAAKGAGLFPSIDAGIEAMVRPGRRILPRQDQADEYDALYRRYRALYPALKGVAQQ